MAPVLFIDDDEFSRQLVTQLQPRLRDERTAAENGAIGVAKTRRQRPDIAITDLFTPERDGIETIGKIRTIYVDMPIVAISGTTMRAASGAANYPDIAQSFGTNAALPRPLNGSALKCAIDLLLPDRTSAVSKSNSASPNHAR